MTPPPDVATVRTVEHEQPSALPETGWLWRRVFVFGLTLGLLLLTWRLTERVSDVATLRMAIHYLMLALMLVLLLYLAGASTEAITRLLAAVRTTRKETITTAPPPAVVTDGKVEAAAPRPPAKEAPPWLR